MRYRTNGDENLLYDLTNLEQSEVEELMGLLGGIFGEANVSSMINNIYHELTQGMNKGDRAREWKELGSDQILQLWASQMEANITEIFDANADVFDDEQFEAFSRAIDILRSI